MGEHMQREYSKTKRAPDSILFFLKDGKAFETILCYWCELPELRKQSASSMSIPIDSAVKILNSHDKLVEALKTALSLLESHSIHELGYDTCFNQMNQALKEAEAL